MPDPAALTDALRLGPAPHVTDEQLDETVGILGGVVRTLDAP